MWLVKDIGLSTCFCALLLLCDRNSLSVNLKEIPTMHLFQNRNIVLEALFCNSVNQMSTMWMLLLYCQKTYVNKPWNLETLLWVVSSQQDGRGCRSVELHQTISQRDSGSGNFDHENIGRTCCSRRGHCTASCHPSQCTGMLLAQCWMCGIYLLRVRIYCLHTTVFYMY